MEHSAVATPIFGRTSSSFAGCIRCWAWFPSARILVFHLVTNVSILDGPETFQRRVDQIHSLGPRQRCCSSDGCSFFLPILFHGLIGLMIVARGKRNVLELSVPRELPLHAASGGRA